ncbi:MAG: DUF5924 family protein [Thermoanaerobaculum sp.]
MAEGWRSLWQRLQERFEGFYTRYGRVFWTLHSVWALLTGVLVLVLAHNRYGYIRWVVLFLALTWVSTLFFSRFSQRFAVSSHPTLRLAQGFVSYLTRVMYQETLFFLLPFYFYSTTFPSWNALYVLVLAGLAVFSCMDIPFDRVFRSSRFFAMGYFVLVTFSALNFFFPLLAKVRTHQGLYLAAGLSFLAALPLAVRLSDFRDWRKAGAILLVLLLTMGLVRLARPLIPPVPLRLAKLRFTTQLDPRTLRSGEEFEREVPAEKLSGGKLYAVATVFSPVPLPTSLVIRWQDGSRTLRSSRAVEVIAHARGFRIWDVVNVQRVKLGPGRYRVEVWTAEGQLVGRVPLRVGP